MAILKTKIKKEKLQNGARTGTMTKLDLNLEGVSLDDFNKDQIRELAPKKKKKKKKKGFNLRNESNQTI